MVTYEITRSSLTKGNYSNCNIKSIAENEVNDTDKKTEAIADVIARMIIDNRKKRAAATAVTNN
jgi:hypothetical protein